MYKSSPSDAKTFGDIEGIPVGTFFLDRKHLAEAGMHGRPLWGIHGSEEDGAYAVVMNGGYEDDRDRGETVIYAGHGKGKAKGQPKITGSGPISRLQRKFHGMQSWDAAQVGDQTWTRGNKALKRSSETKLPVRLIRGPDGNPAYSPFEGYRYDGLYNVVRYWEEKGSKGFIMCMFELQRRTDQEPLPRIIYPKHFWEFHPTVSSESKPRKSRTPETTHPAPIRASDGGSQRVEHTHKAHRMKKPYVSVPTIADRTQYTQIFELGH